MERALTNEQMRAADSYTINTLGVSSETLMRRAGEAIADEVEKAVKKLYADSVLVVCGIGNNGGDGYVCARELLKRGINVKVYAFSGSLSVDCAREKSLYTGEYSGDIMGAIVVDCIFGTGLGREVCGEYLNVINEINALDAYVISADIPSGLNGDNGVIMGAAVMADKTIAIAEYKYGMFLNDGFDYCGEIVKKDIGIICPDDKYILTNYMCTCSAFFKTRRRNTHKGTYGTAAFVAGSDKYTGAAVLTMQAALKSGCGYVKLKTSEKLKYALTLKFPQVIFTDDIDLQAAALAVGMGCGINAELYHGIKYILENYTGKLILDADALNVLSEYGVNALSDKNCSVLITPHIKEFSRLSGLTVSEITNNPVKAARDFANKFGVTVLLKSCTSVITDGEKTFINVRGTTALAKGGSGDILSGFICGSCARGLDLFDGAVCGAQTLGIAAEIASENKTDYCAMAEDIINNLHFSIKRLTE